MNDMKVSKFLLGPFINRLVVYPPGYSDLAGVPYSRITEKSGIPVWLG